jgi:pteridine reductase
MKKVALITGAAKRIGASIAKLLHQQGMNVVLHYHRSEEEAQVLCRRLNSIRDHSAALVRGNICLLSDCQAIIEKAYQVWNQLDILINNASGFYVTPIGKVDENSWEELLGSNLKGPFFLCQAAIPYMPANQGNIINIVATHAEKPLKNYSVYSIAKAGLAMLTKSLARELAPAIRVNAVAPGLILWQDQENALPKAIQDDVINRTCLKRQGKPEDIAEAVLFLIKQDYIVGQTITIDGGRSVKG